MVTSFHLVWRCLDKLRNIQSIPIYPLERNTLGGGKSQFSSREFPFILQRASIYSSENLHLYSRGKKKKISIYPLEHLHLSDKKKFFYFIHLKNSIDAPEHPYLLSRINLHVPPHLHFSIYPPEKSQFMLHENLNLCSREFPFSLQQIAGQIPPKVLKVWRFFKTQSTWISP